MDEKLVDALDSVTWYNGLAEYIIEWKELKHITNIYGSYILDWDYYFNLLDAASRSQIQVIWMICVNLFGNWGTSPRTGWIDEENKEAFFKFIDDITAIYQDSLTTP